MVVNDCFYEVRNACCYEVGNDDCFEDGDRDYDALAVGNDVLDLGSFVGGEV